MGLQKLGITLTEQCVKYAKACGKSSILCTKPVQVPNIEGLRYVRGLTEDVLKLENPLHKRIGELLRYIKNDTKFMPNGFWFTNKNIDIAEYIIKNKKLLPKEFLQLESLKQAISKAETKKQMDILYKIFDAKNLRSSEHVMNNVYDIVEYVNNENFSKFINHCLNKNKLFNNPEIMNNLSEFNSFFESEIKKDKNFSVHKFINFFEYGLPKIRQFCPEVKDFNIRQKLLLCQQHYKNGFEKITKEQLMYPKNINNLLQEDLLYQGKIHEILTRYPLTQRNIGKIPTGWLNETGTSTPKLEAEIFKQIDFFCKNKNVKIFENNLSTILKKKVKLTPLEEGEFGTPYKISIEGAPDTVIKFFKSYIIGGNLHGGGIEPQLGMFLNKNSDRFVHMYCGKLTNLNNHDGYIITQYLDENVRPILGCKNPNYQIKYDDCRRSNLINGVIIDYGGTNISHI